MDRLGTINEGWTAESAADERLREYLAQTKPSPPSTDNENVRKGKKKIWLRTQSSYSNCR